MMVKDEFDVSAYVRSELKGGRGDVQITEYVGVNDVLNCRLFCEQVIPIDGSIGMHVHSNESEIYLIRSGCGVVIDGHKERSVSPGSVIVTKHGEAHSIRNIGKEPLVLIAVIITHK